MCRTASVFSELNLTTFEIFYWIRFHLNDMIIEKKLVKKFQAIKSYFGFKFLMSFFTLQIQMKSVWIFFCVLKFQIPPVPAIRPWKLNQKKGSWLKWASSIWMSWTFKFFFLHRFPLVQFVRNNDIKQAMSMLFITIWNTNKTFEKKGNVEMKVILSRKMLFKWIIYVLKIIYSYGLRWTTEH